MHTLYPVNHLIKTTLESTLRLHFDSFKSQHQLLRNLKFYQLHFIWVLLYVPSKYSQNIFTSVSWDVCSVWASPPRILCTELQPTPLRASASPCMAMHTGSSVNIAEAQWPKANTLSVVPLLEAVKSFLPLIRLGAQTLESLWACCLALHHVTHMADSTGMVKMKKWKGLDWSKRESKCNVMWVSLKASHCLVELLSPLVGPSNDLAHMDEPLPPPTQGCHIWVWGHPAENTMLCPSNNITSSASTFLIKNIFLTFPQTFQAGFTHKRHYLFMIQWF